MQTLLNTTTAAILATAMCLGAQSTSAASITIDTWAATGPVNTNATMTVDDDTAGVLAFNLTIPNDNAELSAVWLDFGGTFSFSVNDLTSGDNAITIQDFNDNLSNDSNALSNQGGDQRNLNGGFSAPVNGGSGTFDFGFGFDDGDNGGNALRIDLPYSFTLSDLGGTLGLGDLERVGLRFQSVGTAGQDGLGGGSEKLIGFPNTSLTSVPLPAGLPLLAAGMVAFGLVRRKARLS